jgi:ligand-binding sensor domain-containing protein
MPQFLKPGFNKILFLCCFFWITQRVKSQTIPINFRHYSLADGLSSYKVVKILQDHFGFMWIATQDGLNRFDGKDIVIYNKSATEKHLLAGIDINDILEDTVRNILWAISSYGGVNGIDIKTGIVKYSLSVNDSSSHFTHGWLKCLTINKEDIWIGTFDGITIYNPVDGKFKKTPLLPFQKSKHNNNSFDVNLLYTDEYENVWAFVANYGLVIFSGVTHSVIALYSLPALHLAEEYTFRQFNDVQNIELGKMMLATYRGIKKIEYNNTGLLKVTDEKIPGNTDLEIRSFHQDKDNNLWFASANGLFKLNQSKSHLVTIKDVNNTDQKKWLNSINSVFFDRRNNLWLGTLQGFALATSTHAIFQNYFQSADLKAKINRAYSIYPYNDSAEYVCAEDGFYQVNNSSGNIKLLKGGIAFSFIDKLADGNIMVSAENQLFIFYPPDKFTRVDKIYPELSILKNETINSIAQLGDSVVFIGSEIGNGVYEWDCKKKWIRKIDSKSTYPLKSDIVNTVYKDSRNNIWILSDNSFAIYNPANKNVENYELTNPTTKQPLNLYFDVCETANSFWLAAYGSGIVELDKDYKIKQIISTNQGISNAGIYKIFPVGDTILFATSNNGLCSFNIYNNTVSNYFEQDGLHSNAFEESCGALRNGKIYAGGPNGFTIINPKYLIPNSIPPWLYINRLLIKTKTGLSDTANLFLKSVKIPNNALQVTIYFSGINYSNPERNIYHYRIKEQHNEWISLGNQNTFQLTELPPGTYTLQIKAANENGVLSAPAELEIIFLPKWFQTWWFYSLLLIITATGIYSLFRYRLRQKINLLEMRNRISQDLHDEIGASISGINLLSQIASEKLENNKLDEAAAYLFKVKNYTQDVIEKLSDMVWIFNPQNDSIEKLLQRLKSFAISIASSKNIKMHFVTDKESESINLSIRQRKAIYLISKEALNNMFKYASCNNIYYTLSARGSKWVLRINDDGKGFNIEKNSTGNGLKNMQARADEIGADFNIESQIGAGTNITLEL